MKTEAVFVNDAFLNNERLINCGYLLLCEYTSPSDPVLYYSHDNDSNILYCEPTHNGEILNLSGRDQPANNLFLLLGALYLCDIVAIGTNSVANCAFIWIRWTKDGPTGPIHKLKVFLSGPQTSGGSWQTRSELEALLDFRETAFPGVPVKELKDRMIPRIDHDGYDKDKYYRNTIIAYTQFINKHSVSKKEFKKMMKKEKNFPKFVRSLGWIKDQPLFECLKYFVAEHICQNRSCKGFAWLKCSECLMSHYCNTECQAKDWNNHKESCKRLCYFRERTHVLGSRLHEVYAFENKCVTVENDRNMNIMIHIAGNTKDIVTFDAFDRILKRRLFYAFSDLLKEAWYKNHLKFFINHARDFFGKDFSNKDPNLIFSLAKNKKGVEPKELVLQMIESYTRDNIMMAQAKIVGRKIFFMAPF